MGAGGLVADEIRSMRFSGTKPVSPENNKKS